MAVVKERLGGEVWCVGSGITSAVDPSFRASASLFPSRASGKSSGRNPSRTNPGLKICGGGWRLVAGKSGETTPALQQGRRFGASSTHQGAQAWFCPGIRRAPVSVMACSNFKDANLDRGGEGLGHLVSGNNRQAIGNQRTAAYRATRRAGRIGAVKLRMPSRWWCQKPSYDHMICPRNGPDPSLTATSGDGDRGLWLGKPHGLGFVLLRR